MSANDYSRCVPVRRLVETLHLKLKKYFYIFYAEWSHQPCRGLMFSAFRRGGGRRFGPPLNTPLCSTVGDQAIAVAGARLWNSLPHDIVAIDTLSHFRRGLKTFLFSQSYPIVYLYLNSIVLSVRLSGTVGFLLLLFLLLVVFILYLYCIMFCLSGEVNNYILF